MTALLGLTAPATSDGVAPVGIDDLLLVLRQRNQRELEDQLGPTAWERLLAWGDRDPEALQIQTGLKTLWGISQPAVAQTMPQLTAVGVVEDLPRMGREPIQYMLTGATGVLDPAPSAEPGAATPQVSTKSQIPGVYWKDCAPDEYLVPAAG